MGNTSIPGQIFKNCSRAFEVLPYLAYLTKHIFFLKYAKYDRPSKAREQFLQIWPGIDVPKI